MALVKSAQEILWLRKLEVITVWSGGKPKLLMENKSAEAFANGTGEWNQWDHIDITYHLIRDFH